MDAFLVHRDEELINPIQAHSKREGRSFGRGHALLDNVRRQHTPRELAFWINFYSLFYERVFIPVNFLTDSVWTIPILTELGYGREKEPLICSEESPVRVFWDSERWCLA